jgi:WavE lipopolysaccharide synthesis
MKNFLIYFNKIIIILIEKIESIFGYFFILNLKSIKVSNLLNERAVFNESNEELGILMQGSLLYKQNFTIETLRLYRYVYPNIKIVLSTWDDVSQEILNRIKNYNIDVLINEKPLIAGKSNINLQLLSTQNGLKKLQQFGVKYVLKTRTDQRVYVNKDFLSYFKYSIKVSINDQNCLLKSKFIVSNLNMFKGRYYCISDMFMFGSLDDMYFFWDMPCLENNFFTCDTSIDFSYNTPEGYIIKEFFKKLNYHPLNTYNDSLEFIKSHFIVIDKNIIELFWYKYNHILIKNKYIVDGKLDEVFSVLDQY